MHKGLTDHSNHLIISLFFSLFNCDLSINKSHVISSLRFIVILVNDKYVL